MTKIIPSNYLPNHPNTGDWQGRHKGAMAMHPIGQAISAWVLYAENHAYCFESDIGQDYVLGPAWARWGAALRELLNGELGGLDAGTCDHILYQNLANQGFDPENL